jgi:hypothetical protein
VEKAIHVLSQVQTSLEAAKHRVDARLCLQRESYQEEHLAGTCHLPARPWSELPQGISTEVARIKVNLILT